MKKAYDFDNQIKFMKDMFQSNISLAQNANLYLKSMSLSLIKKAVKQLKEQYEEQYLKQDQQKYNSIRYTLNLIANQKITNVDELFMTLAFQINLYYGVKYFDIRKKIQYFQQCTYCERNLSNYHYGIKIHEANCRQNKKINKTASEKKIELIDHTKENQSNQNKFEISRENCTNIIEKENFLSKKQALTAKINRKRKQILKKYRKVENQQEQAYKGFMNFDRYDINMNLLEEQKLKNISEDQQRFTSSTKPLSIELESTFLYYDKKLKEKKSQYQQDSHEFF